MRTILEGSRMLCKRLALLRRIFDLACQPFREFGAVAAQSSQVRGGQAM
jgi:hypothetical protein